MTLTAIIRNMMKLRMLARAAAASWYVAPWLASRPRTEALTVLLWVQAFWNVALQRPRRRAARASRRGVSLSKVRARGAVARCR